MLPQTTGRVDITKTPGRSLVVSAEVAKAGGIHLRPNAHTTHHQEMQTPVAVVARVWLVILRATPALELKGLVHQGTTPVDSMAQVSERWVETEVAAFSTSRSVVPRRFQLSRPADRLSMVRRGRFQYPQRPRTRKRSRISGRRQNRQQQAHGRMSLAQRRRRIRLVQPSGLRTTATSTGWSSRQPRMV